MTAPLNSSEQNQIQSVENALEQYIKRAESGNTSKGDLSSIQQQINALLKNPNIPSDVQESLQAAANELKQVQTGGGNIVNLYNAKMQVDSVLGIGESENLGEKGGQPTS